MKKVKYEIGSGKTALTYEVIPLGSDFLILVYGGEAHIGCTAIGDKGSLASYTAAHHRDDVLAISLAQKLSERFHCVCTVVAGFHLDEISTDEIQEVLKNAEEGAKRVIEGIENI